MKRIILFTVWVLSCFWLEAQPASQHVYQVNIKNLPLKKAVLEFSKQTGVGVTFDGRSFPNQKISLRITSSSLKDILEALTKNTPLGYQMKDKQVVFFKQPVTQQWTVSGVVRDQTTGEHLIATNVYLPELEKGVVTNEYGFFSMTLNPGWTTITFSFLGYKSQQKRLHLNKDIQLDIRLQPAIMLNEVIVTSRPPNNQLSNISIGKTSFLASEVADIPARGGEADPYQLLELMPGVISGPDGFGGLAVRGGSPDQNLILLDGAPVYSPTHLAGLFSIFNNDILSRATFFKSNIPARYGGRLSSLLDIRTREGNQQQLTGSLSAGITSVKATLEGPIKKGHSSFLVTGRKSIFGEWLRPISRKYKEQNGGAGATQIDFSDFNAKFNWNIGSKNRILLHFYNGNDQFNDVSVLDNQVTSGHSTRHQQTLDWKNRLASLRWNYILNDRYFINTTFSLSEYRFLSKELYEEKSLLSIPGGESSTPNLDGFYNQFQSALQEWRLTSDLTLLPSLNHQIHIGYQLGYSRFRPGAYTIAEGAVLGLDERGRIDSIQAQQQQYDIREYQLYAEDEWKVGPNWLLNMGVRASWLDSGTEYFFHLLPRLGVRWQMDSLTSFSASWSHTRQPLHLLSTSGLGLPADLWVPATSGAAPQQAQQWTLGVQRAWKNGLLAGIETYYRELNNLLAYQEGSSFLVQSLVLDANRWEQKVTQGRGRAYGVEFLIKKHTQQFTSQLNYTFSRSFRQFEAINFGAWYADRFDRPHSLKITATWQINAQWSVQTAWRFDSGSPTTLPNGVYTINSSNWLAPVGVVGFGSKNESRLPANHRLDLSTRYLFGKKRGQTLLLGIYNVYNRENPLYYRLAEKNDGSGEKEFVQATLLPFTPFFRYTVKF